MKIIKSILVKLIYSDLENFFKSLSSEVMELSRRCERQDRAIEILRCDIDELKSLLNSRKTMRFDSIDISDLKALENRLRIISNETVFK